MISIATRGRRLDDRGSATLELAVLGPALLVLVGLVIAGGRVQVAHGAIEQAAAAASRSASLARGAATAGTAAADSATAVLSEQGIDCDALTVSPELDGFAVPAGQPAVVSVTVSCTIALGDLMVPGLPGARTLTATSTSPLDTYRSRGGS